MITISEAIKNSCLRTYPVVCGAKGIDNEVLKIGIIDYEFAIDGFLDDNNSFEYGDFLITSLLFTKGNKDMFIAMIKELIRLGVSGLAIKNVFFKEIPEEIKELCDEHALPIILFDNGVYFEEIMSDVEHLIQLSDWINRNETNIDMLLKKDLSRYEVEGIVCDMDIRDKPYAKAYYLGSKRPISQKAMKRTIKRFVKGSIYNKTCSLLKHKKNYVIIVTADSKDDLLDKQKIFGLAKESGIDIKDYRIGISDIYNTKTQLDYCIKESRWSWQIAEIMDANIQSYRNLGSWSLIIANQTSSHMVNYMERYLNPLTTMKADSQRDLMATAIAYIKCEGNLKEAARHLNIHDNTLRYRLNKLREKLDNNASDFIFYENLSLAVRIYLLRESNL